MYMEIHVYSTLAYVHVGREERQPLQTMNMHVHMYMYLYTNNNTLEDTCMYENNYGRMEQNKKQLYNCGRMDVLNFNLKQLWTYGRTCTKTIMLIHNHHSHMYVTT